MLKDCELGPEGSPKTGPWQGARQIRTRRTWDAAQKIGIAVSPFWGAVLGFTL